MPDTKKTNKSRCQPRYYHGYYYRISMGISTVTGITGAVIDGDIKPISMHGIGTVTYYIWK